MTQFVVNVPEEQELFFKELMEKLNFRHELSESLEVEIPEWHKSVIDERLDHYRKYPEDVVDVDSMLDKFESML